MGQEGRVAWLVLGAEGSAMFGEGTLGFYGSNSLVKKVRHLLTVTQLEHALLDLLLAD
jgi:hypothetical protein